MNYIGCSCCPPGKKQESIASPAPILVNGFPIEHNLLHNFRLHMHKFQAIPHPAAKEKMHSEELSMGLRVAPMKLVEICTKQVTTAVTRLRDRAKMILNDEQT